MKEWIVYFTIWSAVCALNLSSISSPCVRGLGRSLSGSDFDSVVEKSMSKYFKGFRKIYEEAIPACLSQQRENGWTPPKDSTEKGTLPLYVIAVGTEASGHQMWKMLLENSIFDCIWPLPSKTVPAAGSHLTHDGFPYLTSEDLEDSLSSQLVLSARISSKDCKSIYDAFSSFPFGSPRNQARVFHHPDLVNLRKLDGVLFNVKYLVLTRNITDSALAVLGRKMSVTVDANLRAFEQNLVYLQAALQGIPCHKLFFASFEQVRLSPEAYIGPLVEFLELKTSDSIAALSESLRSFSNKNKALKSYPLLPQPECGQKKEKACYDLMEEKYNDFFSLRKGLWPLFAGNGKLLES